MTSVRASFDQYARYAYLRRLRQDCYGGQPLRILSVGDPFGTIAALFPGDTTVSVDVYADSPPTDGHSPPIGSGAALPCCRPPATRPGWCCPRPVRPGRAGPGAYGCSPTGPTHRRRG